MNIQRCYGPVFCMCFHPYGHRNDIEIATKSDAVAE